MVEWSCTDAMNGSGVVASTVSQELTNEGANRSAEGTCTDLAGNTASDTQTGINIDLTAPELTSSRTPANGEGWNNGDVTVTWDCTDGLSGVDSYSPKEVFDTEGNGQSAEGTCTDLAGNTDSDEVEGINIDTTAPSIEWTAGPADGSSYVFGYAPTVTPRCEASDSLSGVSGCNVSGFDTTVGTHTLTASATDAAGNKATKTSSYTVRAWTLKGFYQPVDMNGVWNIVKNGSTVPLKFEVFAGNTELTDTSIVSFTANAAACDTGAAADEIELTTTGGTSLRYSDGQFIQNWQTPRTPGKCSKVTMKTTDGSSISALFKLK
jgi:hypothetical protein